MRKSVILKILAYILIPLLLIIIGFNTIYAVYINENRDFLTKETYVETVSFSDRFRNILNEILDNVVNKDLNISNGINYLSDLYYTENELKCLIVDKYTGSFYSNMNINNIETLKHEVENQRYVYNYNEVLNTNIPNGSIETINGYNSVYDSKRFEVYIGFSDVFKLNGEVFLENLMFKYAKAFGSVAIYLIAFYIILEILVVIYLLFAIGHKEGEEKIYQNKFDNLPIEIILGMGFVLDLFLLLFANFVLKSNIHTGISDISILMLSIIVIVLICMYVITAAVGTSFIKKLKTGTLINSSVTYKVCKKVFSWIKKIWIITFDNLNVNVKFIGLLFGLMLITLILCGAFGGLGVIIAFILWIYVIYRVMKWLNQFNKIKDNLKLMYMGNLKVKLNEMEYESSLKEIVIYINEISSGLESAVNEKLKSERLKTELITNVSHDIKTPLTSIINYVDLLKKEDIKNDKIKEYVDVLDYKSQRLKKLIEDLVEASKANSGNIKLDMQKINLVELINQCIGEFDDRFKEKKLNVGINTNKKEEYSIEADTRYMYRIIENVFSNVYKYALEDSRVYIDIKEQNKKIKLEIKNISKDPLNITEEELMERFIRGDKSRNTEGSGLGLSIAKSLTELQKGEFNIIIDGDLFKVEIVF